MLVNYMHELPESSNLIDMLKQRDDLRFFKINYAIHLRDLVRFTTESPCN